MSIQTETRLAAYSRTRATVDRLRILHYIDDQRGHGATCDEAEQYLSLAHQTASARITELRKAGDIEAIAKRPTRTGSPAAVYVAPRFARPVQKNLF